jgi:hypothetical protein
VVVAQEIAASLSPSLSPCKVAITTSGERGIEEEESDKEEERIEKEADTWSPLPRVVHISEPPFKIVKWSNMNGFGGWMVKDFWF